MKINTSIQLKASLLVIVFLLNTIIGFACSVGLDMGFNRSHHQEEKASTARKDGHQQNKTHNDGHQHNQSQHHEDGAVSDHHQSKESKDNCCKDQIVKFEKLDKLIPQSSSITVSPLFFIAFFSSFYHFDAFASYTIIPNNKYFVRSHHPPIPDIRKAIQSFQI